MIYSVGVDISIGFTKEVYYFSYKGISFKYVPHYKKRETDDLMCEILSEKCAPERYELMTEFLAAFTFGNNSQAIVSGGIIGGNPVKLINSRIRFVRKRSIMVTTTMDKFYKLSLLRTPEQIQLARLYREAFSSNNVYLKILFYWHCLVFPNVRETKAVTYIDNVNGDVPKTLEHMKTLIKRICDNRVFLEDVKREDSLGKYIKNSVRHSIAHIVRKPGYGIDLKLDSWEQTRHLNDVAFFMQNIARYRLENDYDMEASNDMKIFHYVKEDELI